MDKLNKIVLNGDEYGIGSSGSGLTNEAKEALLDVVASVPWVDITDGQHKYNTLFTALYPPEELTLNNSALTISTLGNTSQLVATTTPTSDHYVITWESSDTGIATVSQNGLVTAVSDGIATITATCGDVSASCTVLSGAQPLYTLESCSNVAWLDRYGHTPTAYITVSGGNHIKINADGNNSTYYFNGNLSSAETNGVNGRTVSGTWFSIPANSEVEFKIKNCTNWWSTNTKMFLSEVGNTSAFTGAVEFSLTGAERVSLNTNGYFNKTITVENAANINALVMDTTVQSTPAMEFDLQIWINNVRYI